MLNKHRSEAQLVALLTKFLIENSNTGMVPTWGGIITKEEAEAKRLVNCKERAEEFLRNLSDEESEDDGLDVFMAKKFHANSEWHGTSWEECGKKTQSESLGKAYEVLQWIEEYKDEQDKK